MGGPAPPQSWLRLMGLSQLCSVLAAFTPALPVPGSAGAWLCLPGCGWVGVQLCPPAVPAAGRGPPSPAVLCRVRVLLAIRRRFPRLQPHYLIKQIHGAD